MSGALGGLIRRRNLTGMIPGAVLALALLWTAGGGLPVRDAPLDSAAVLGILANGSAQVILVRKSRRIWDFPFDFRFGFTVLAGLILRGAVSLASGLMN
jgi:hypothetical protein